MPSKIPHGESRGWIVPIGGAENKENDRHILERFVRVSGGADADIVVIPTASRMHETGARYEQLFSDLGAAIARNPAACGGSRQRAESSLRAETNCGSRRCSAARRWPNSFAYAMRTA